jgi:hypothetical protein
MKRAIAILMGSVLMVGCVNGKFVSKSVPNQCGGNGWTHTIVHYGDSRVVTVPLSDVEAGQEMRFFLVPKLKGRGARDSQGAIVKIVGKPPADAWFTEISGKASDITIHTCVDGSLAIGDNFEYKVEVYDSTGTDLKAMLDPRAVVIN